MTDNAWVLDLVDQELELPGWRFLPPDLSAQAREQWLTESVADLEGTPGWDEEQVTAEGARELLEEALEQRAGADSVAMLQVWPPLAGRTAICHVNILASEAMPTWTELEDVVLHPVEAPYLGPGVEVITNRTVTLEGVDGVDVTGVHLVFDDGEITVVLSIDETLTPLVSINLPGLVALAGNLRVLNTADGSTFQATAPKGLLVEAPWDFGGTS